MANPATPALMNTYARSELAFERGEGAYLITAEGRRYLDFASGIAVTALGHSHPHLVKTLTEQAQKLWHVSNLYRIPDQERLADRLVANSFADQVFFGNSGAEAIECGLKLIRKWQDDFGDGNRYRVIACEGSFHGRTLATLAAAGNEKYLKGYAPNVEGFDHVPFGNLNELRQKIGPETAAVLVEPVQGEGGVNPMRAEYLRQVRELCDQRGWLLMIDEVQCGMGRTGKWFAHQWAGIVPDVMPLAKGLGSGVPIGAVVAGPKAANLFQPGNHGTTFGGNPLATRAGVETIRIMEEEGLLANAERVGQHLMAALKRELGELPGVTEIRGQGLMIGIELGKPCGVLTQKAADNGLLISVTADNVIRLVPALILTQAEADEIVSRLVPVVKEFLGG